MCVPPLLVKETLWYFIIIFIIFFPSITMYKTVITSKFWFKTNITLKLNLILFSISNYLINVVPIHRTIFDCRLSWNHGIGIKKTYKWYPNSKFFHIITKTLNNFCLYFIWRYTFFSFCSRWDEDYSTRLSERITFRQLFFSFDSYIIRSFVAKNAIDIDDADTDALNALHSRIHTYSMRCLSLIQYILLSNIIGRIM